MILTVALVLAVAAGIRGMWSPCGLSMITSINPMAERARGNSYPVTVAWFVAGAVLGGALLAVPTALGAALVGAVDPPGTVVIAIVAAVVCMLADCGVLALPTHPRQVNETWLRRYRRWIYAAGFGAQIGSGFATYIMTAATYLVVTLAVLTGSAQQAVLICLVFGLVRGLGILSGSRVRSAADLGRVHAALDRHAATSLLVLAVIQGAVAAALAASLAGPIVGTAVGAALAAGVTYRQRIPA